MTVNSKKAYKVLFYNFAQCFVVPELNSSYFFSVIVKMLCLKMQYVQAFELVCLRGELS